MEKINALPGSDDILREELTNGITVLARPNFESPSIVIRGYLPCGSILDPADQSGLAIFLSYCLMRGTAKRDFYQIYEQIESAGASLSFSASTHHILFSARALTEDLPMLLDLIAEVLRFPEFPPNQIEQVRSQLLAGLAIRAQNTQEMAEITFDKALFGDHPYARDDDGTPESIQSITRQDMQRFHQKYFGPEGMVLCIVGGIDSTEAVAKVRDAFELWEKNPNPLPGFTDLPPVSNSEETRKIHVEIPEKSQMDLIVGCTGPNRKSPHYLAAKLGNCILGQFGMMGRIGKVVRDDNGLAYYAGSNLAALPLSGAWEITAGINPQNAEKALRLIRSELKQFIGLPVLPSELDDVQSYFIGRLPLDMESNAGVAYYLLNLERYQLGLDYYREYEGFIRAVTADQILETARTFIDPDRLIIVTAGTSVG